MEEDIKILIEENPTWKKEKAIKNLRNLIKKYKQLEGENKELKEKWDRDCHKIHEIVREEKRIKTDDIPKSKVKEKIEELTKEADNETSKDYDEIDYNKVDELLTKREVCKELLGEED